MIKDINDPKYVSRSTHWNSNIVCAIDIETSGKDPAKHDILQIAVVPLKGDFTPDYNIGAFEMRMAPIKKEEDVEKDAMRTNRLDWRELQSTALDPYKVAELFEEWWGRLKLPFRKSIIPLAHNYTFEYKFLHEWLGPAAMEYYFFQFRDTMALANSLNDYADWTTQPYPYPKTDLGYLCTVLNVENYKPHDALADSLATAECYRKMMQRHTMH